MTIPLPVLVVLTVFAAVGLACFGFLALLVAYETWLDYQAERVRA